LDLEVLDDAEQDENIKSKKKILTSASIPRWSHGPSLNCSNNKSLIILLRISAERGKYNSGNDKLSVKTMN